MPSFVAPQKAHAALTDSLQAYWKFDESSGNAASQVNSNTIVNTNTATFGTPAKLGNAAILASSSSQYFTITNAAQTGLHFTTAVSFNVWLNLTNQLGNNNPIAALLTKDDDATNQREYVFEYRDVSGTKKLSVFNPGTCAAASGELIDKNVTISAGSFKMVTFTYDVTAKTVTYYVDGVSQGTTVGTNTSLPSTCTSAVDVGADHIALPGSSVNGKMDEVGVWSKVLTPAEVTSLYNSGAGLTYPFTTTATTPFFWNWDLSMAPLMHKNIDVLKGLLDVPVINFIS